MKNEKKKSSLVDDVQGVIIFGQSSQMSGGVQWVEMVFCYQNCSGLLREKNCSSYPVKLLKFEAEGQKFANILRSLKQFAWTVKG